MKYSRNLVDLYSPPICKFKELACEKLDKKKKIYDLNQAVPNYLPPENIKMALREALEDTTYPYYTAGEGFTQFREAICEELNLLYDPVLSVENIFVVAGANNAFYSLLPGIAGPGDEIILISPYYFNHHMAAIIYGVKPVEAFSDAEEGFKLPIENIRQKLSKQTKAVVLVNPSNPTGRSYSQAEINELINLCVGNGIFLISDEVYNYFHDDYPNPASVINRFDSNKEDSEFIVSIHSYSKTFSLTGLRVGFLVAHKALLNIFAKVHDTNIISAPSIAQLAALEGLNSSKSWLEDKIAMMRRRLKVFEREFRQKKSMFKISSSGSFFVYLKHAFSNTSYEICENLAEKENLIMLPGEFFGSGQEKAIRIALGNLDEENIENVVGILHNFKF